MNGYFICIMIPDRKVFCLALEVFFLFKSLACEEEYYFEYDIAVAQMM